jgi:nucleoside-diphosphate-sugar epimerase
MEYRRDNNSPLGDGRILVTGGAGLVGKELITQLLERGGKSNRYF